MSRAEREVSVSALTTGVPLAGSAQTAKKRSFLIEILLAGGLGQERRCEADKFWQSRNDAFRQQRFYCWINPCFGGEGLVFADTCGELAGVFLAPA